MLTYYIKLYKYINILLLFLQFCDHSKCILTLNHAVKESSPDARGLVLSNVTRFHGTLFRVICLVFGKILLMSDRTSLKQQLLYYLR